MKNLEVYKSERPPKYPIEKITSEVHLWYIDNDEFVAVDDVLALADRLPKKVLHHIEEPLWGHSDYYLHNEIRKYLNEPVIKIMQQYEQNQKWSRSVLLSFNIYEYLFFLHKFLIFIRLTHRPIFEGN